MERHYEKAEAAQKAIAQRQILCAEMPVAAQPAAE
jgi:hypothetical protein